MKRFNSGDFRHLVTVQWPDPNAAKDDYDQPKKEFVDLGKMRVKIEPMTGREYWAAAQVQAENTYRMTGRWQSGWQLQDALITPQQLVQGRIQFGTRLFDVVSAANVEERNVLMELICKEKIDG